MIVEEVEFKLGDVEFSGKDIATRSVKFDKIAINQRGELYLISLIADTQVVKQIRAILSGGAKAVGTASGVKVNTPGGAYYQAYTPGRIQISPEGYSCHVQKIGYGMAHALFITRSVGFMKVVSDESMWQELNDIRFTTPILKEWVPFIEKELRRLDLLEWCYTFGCKCANLSATTLKLDQIVSSGLQDFNLIIPRPPIALPA